MTNSKESKLMTDIMEQMRMQRIVKKHPHMEQILKQKAKPKSGKPGPTRKAGKDIELNG